MSKISVYCFICLFFIFSNIGSSLLNPFNRDFLFLPKFSKHGRLQMENSRPHLTRTVIYNRDKLDPANQNVYQDSATLKTKNHSGQSEEDVSERDDSRFPSDSANQYVPVKVTKQESRTNPSTSPDSSVQSNNFQNDKKHPRNQFVDADEFFRPKPDGERNSKNRQNSDPFMQFEKEFEDIFKLDDFKDFFNTRFII